LRAKQVYFCGFSGAGKTSLGQRVSEQDSNIEFLDLDQQIAPGGVSKYIENHGWEAFRASELKEIDKCVGTFWGCVALGGGALNQKSLDLIKNSGGILVWLDVDFETCWGRIQNDPERPLVTKGKDEMLKLYNERMEFYAQADIVLKKEEAQNWTSRILEFFK